MGKGYVLTAKGTDALALYDDPDVRFVAEMTDGSGFVAFNDEHGQFEAHGAVYMEREHTGPAAFLWPWRAAPKRGIGTGREYFALLPIEFEGEIHRLSAVTGCTPVGDGSQILVESDGPVVLTTDFWESKVHTFLDKRTALEPVLV